MAETIIAALISAICSVLITIITIRADNRKYRQQRDEADALWKQEQALKLKAIEEKVDKHNAFYDKVNRCELNDVRLEGQIKALDARINAYNIGH